MSQARGRVMLVTGATDGIGKETARQLGAAGAHVLVHGRAREKAEATARELAQATGKDAFEPVAGDLSRLSEVRALADQVLARHPVLDVLVNNAGIFAAQYAQSPDGNELTLAVNHLAPFALTHWLLPAIEKSEQGRIVNVSSGVHGSGSVDLEDLDGERGWSGYGAYANTKLMNLLFTYELARRLAGSKVTVNALHPGVIATKLLRSGFGAGGAPVASGARTSVKLALDPALATVTGRYFVNEREAQSSPASHDEDLARGLYRRSCARTGVQPLGEPAPP
jgi:NAD(P)-dependent dehydrogenase (short-subunit alcohol dehydrogenase family)